MKIFFILISLISSIVGFGQIDTIYYDAKWKVCSQDSAQFASIRVKKDKHWLQEDYYYPEYQIQMRGQYLDNKELVKDGCFTWYDKNSTLVDSALYQKGEKKYSFSFYENGSPAGRYVFKKNETVDETYWDENGKELFDLKEYNSKPSSWKDYIASALQNDLPKEYSTGVINGTVIIEFTIDRDGYPKNPVVFSSSGYPVLDEHAKNIILNGPRWHPAVKNGKAIAVTRKQPITYDKL